MFVLTVRMNCLSVAEQVWLTGRWPACARPLPTRNVAPKTTTTQIDVAAMRRRGCTETSIGGRCVQPITRLGLTFALHQVGSAHQASRMATAPARVAASNGLASAYLTGRVT